MIRCGLEGFVKLPIPRVSACFEMDIYRLIYL
jgi:hypothetical protein